MSMLVLTLYRLLLFVSRFMLRGLAGILQNLLQIHGVSEDSLRHEKELLFGAIAWRKR